MTSINNEFRSHINTIINANRNKMLAVFIGAGISKTSNTPNNEIPDWSKLINKINYELDDNKEREEDINLSKNYRIPHIPTTISSFLPHNPKINHLVSMVIVFHHLS